MRAAPAPAAVEVPRHGLSLPSTPRMFQEPSALSGRLTGKPGRGMCATAPTERGNAPAAPTSTAFQRRMGRGGRFATLLGRNPLRFLPKELRSRIELNGQPATAIIIELENGGLRDKG